MVRLRFHTPLRLQNNGRHATAEEHTARKLFDGAGAGVALLSEFHGPGPLELDFTALARQAEAIDRATRLNFQGWTRYSSRQQKR